MIAFAIPPIDMIVSECGSENTRNCAKETNWETALIHA